MASSDGSLPWELYCSDLKLSKIKRALPSLRFDIPIPPQAPKYIPGSGPPPRVDLRLVHDTNAYIIDKIVLPLEPFTQRNDPRQRRVYYIVGWPDLPAARPVVVATSILDYVSPRTLEDWEYQDALRREEVREAEKRALEKGKGVAAPGKPGPKPGKKRKLGRPPGARLMDAPPPEPVLDSDQKEMLQRRKSGPSLSTPQKSRLAQLVAEEELLELMEDVEEEDPVSVVQQKFQDEVLGGDSMDLDTDVGTEEPDGVNSYRSSSAVSMTSRGQTSRASSSRPGPSRQSPVDSAKSLARTAVAGTATTRGIPLAAYAETPGYSSSSPASHLSQPPPISKTPVPLPPYLSNSIGPGGLWKKPHEAMQQSGNFVSSKETGTPTGYGRGAHSTTQPPESSYLRAESNLSSTRSSPSRANGFTPIGGMFPRPPKRPAPETPSAADTPTNTQSKKERKLKAAKLSQPPPEPELEHKDQGAGTSAEGLVQMAQDYVVKRLEGDHIIDGIHWFRVRWEGNWPPDQNPTWEPKENISAKLVTEYLKRKAKREAENPSKKNTPNAAGSSAGKSKDKRQSSLAEWAKRYNSVSEAFEGKAELDDTTDAMVGRRGNWQPELEDDGDHDELLVVEPNNAEDRVKEAEARKRRSDAQLAAQFASMARGGPRAF